MQDDGQTGWWEWVAPRPWRHMPRPLRLVSIVGVLWGAYALVSLILGEVPTPFPTDAEGTVSGKTVAAVLAVLSIAQGALVLRRIRLGLYLLWIWSAAVVLAFWAETRGPNRGMATAFAGYYLSGVSIYAWTQWWWFSGAETEGESGGEDLAARPQAEQRTGLMGIDAAPFAQEHALFRDVLPERFRHLPPFFYQFVAAGTVFGGLALAATATVLPIVATEFAGPGSRAALAIVPSFGTLGLVQAWGILSRARWALWAIYAWFLSIAVGAWIYLPMTMRSTGAVARAAAPLGVSIFLGLCAYYFWNRREWFTHKPQDGEK